MLKLSLTLCSSDKIHQGGVWCILTTHYETIYKSEIHKL